MKRMGRGRGRGKFKAVVFDLDGTLVQTPIDWMKMREKLIEQLCKLGIDRDSIDSKQTTDKLVRRVNDFLRRKRTPNSVIADVMRRLDEIMSQIELQNVEKSVPRKGARNLLKRLRDEGVKIGILTRGCKAYAIKALGTCHMLEFVDAMGTRTDPLKAKPDPESILSVCRSLGLEPREVISVGDHPMDVECAGKAGISFVGVLGGASNEEALRRAGCGKIVKGIDDLEVILFRRSEKR